MAFSKEYAEHILDLLEPLGTISIKRMFGGGGVYWGASMFALIADEVLYFKVDDESMDDFKAAGSEPFTYMKKDKPVILGRYWRVPDEIFDEVDEMQEWARRSIDVALADNKAKAMKKKGAVK